jgi:hypothetical protein
MCQDSHATGDSSTQVKMVHACAFFKYPEASTSWHHISTNPATYTYVTARALFAHAKSRCHRPQHTGHALATGLAGRQAAPRGEGAGLAALALALAEPDSAETRQAGCGSSSSRTGKTCSRLKVYVLRS